MTRKTKREFNIIVSIQEKLIAKSEEILDETRNKLIEKLETEYSEILSELLKALEDYGWSR